MKKHNLLDILMSRFVILFNLTKQSERPSKDKKQCLPTIKAIVLPHKQNIMIDEFSGYTKTKIQVQEVYKGNHTINDIIEICEPYYEGVYGGEKCMIVHESYEPLHIGKVYTFFLTKKQDEDINTRLNEWSQEEHEDYSCINIYGDGLCHKIG